MSMPGQEIQIGYDDAERDCHAILDSGKVIGLGATNNEALEDLREAAHFYIDTTINLKLQEINGSTPLQGREENGSD